ncbi:MAG TPA: CBS domain-containing protein [Polyangiaceae bacterium]
MSREPMPTERSTSETLDNSGTVVAGTAPDATTNVAISEVPHASSPTIPDSALPADTERINSEILEIDPESIPSADSAAPIPVAPPPPRSLRLQAAKDSKSPPLGVTAQLPAAMWPPKTVADLMTRKIITVGEREPIGNLEDMMQKFRFRHLPVVGEGMKLVGLIARSDLLHAELGRMPDGTPAPKVDRETLAGAIMNKVVVFATLDTPLATACQVMMEKKLTCVPIVLADHTLVGIITESDFIRLTREWLRTASQKSPA